MTYRDRLEALDNALQDEACPSRVYRRARILDCMRGDDSIDADDEYRP